MQALKQAQWVLSRAPGTNSSRGTQGLGQHEPLAHGLLTHWGEVSSKECGVGLFARAWVKNFTGASREGRKDSRASCHVSQKGSAFRGIVLEKWLEECGGCHLDPVEAAR